MFVFIQKKEMFYEAPIISLLIFGFPFGVISVVCYFLCCLDSTDDTTEGNDLSDSEIDDDEEYNITEAAVAAPVSASISSPSSASQQKHIKYFGKKIII